MLNFFERDFLRKEQISPFLEKAKISALTIIGFLTAFDTDALAKIQREAIEPHTNAFVSPIFELSYKKDETQKNPEYIRVVSLHELGKNSTSEHIASNLFDLINKTEIVVPGVNYGIENESEFEKFLLWQSEEAKHRLNFSWATMSDLTPRELTMTAIAIAHANLKYEHRIERSTPTQPNPIYDENLKREINAMPIDKLLKNGKGVCRHFSASVKTIFNTLKKISHSPYLNNISMHEIVYPEENHSVNVVTELVGEGKGPVVKIMFIDTTPPPALPINNQRKLLEWTDTLTTTHERIKGAFETYFFPTFTPTEQREVLKNLFEFREQKKPNLSLLEFVISSYKQEITALHDKGDIVASENLVGEVSLYLKKIQPVIEAAVETPLEIPVDQFLRIMKDYEYFGNSTNEIQILKDAYDHRSTENQLEEKIKIGQEYAEALGRQGNLDAAITLYRELFSGYKKYNVGEHPIIISQTLTGGELIEPFDGEKNFEKFLMDKKQQWLKFKK